MHRKTEPHQPSALPDVEDAESTSPGSDLEEESLDEALRETFPASDPVAISVD